MERQFDGSEVQLANQALNKAGQLLYQPRIAVAHGLLHGLSQYESEVTDGRLETETRKTEIFMKGRNKGRESILNLAPHWP